MSYSYTIFFKNNSSQEKEIILFGSPAFSKKPTEPGAEVDICTPESADYTYESLRQKWQAVGTVSDFLCSHRWTVRTEDGYKSVEIASPKKFKTDCNTAIIVKLRPGDTGRIEFEFKEMEESSPATKKLTYGEKAVGLTFNPSKFPEVDRIKRLSADLIDEIVMQMQKVGRTEITVDATTEGHARGMEMSSNLQEAQFQFECAIRKIQEGQMWAVKAATWQI